jgi:RNA polymerase sigma factor (sigma-70 family)
MTPADGDTVISHLRRTLRAGVFAGAPDEELLERFVAQRDEAAFAALLRRHGPLVWGICQRLLAHRQDAEDAFQATFLVLARKAASIGRRKLLANWLFGVARRAALNLRAVLVRRARQEQLRADPPNVPAPRETPWDDVRAVLDEELARMPEKYRLPLLLCGLEGMTHAEASKYLDWPTGTVAGRLSRGRELLRARLFRRGITVPAAALTAVLAPGAASAAVPPRLAAALVRDAAALVTAGKSAAEVSPVAATLMRRVLLKMFLSRLLKPTALLAALALTLGGAGAVWHRTPAAGPPPSAPAGLAPGPFRSAATPRPKAPVLATKPTRTDVPGKPAIRLPTDEKAVVLRMERSVESSPGPGIALTIYADGRVVAEVPDGLFSLSPTDLTRHVKDRGTAEDSAPQKIKVLEGRLSRRELEEILRFALHEQEFFDFDQAAVQAAIRDTYHCEGSVRDGNDATTTSFRIQTADRNHEVTWSRLDKAAWEFPKIERLLQLHAVDRRLSRVYYVLLAGGPERVEEVVAKVNQLVLPFYRRYPDLPRLTAADLFKVTPSADGSRVEFTFSRNKDKAVRNPLFEVSIDVPKQGEPRLCYVMPPQMARRSGERLVPPNSGSH